MSALDADSMRIQSTLHEASNQVAQEKGGWKREHAHVPIFPEHVGVWIPVEIHARSAQKSAYSRPSVYVNF